MSAIVQASFRAYVAPAWEPGACASFLDESSVEGLAPRIEQATFAALAELDDSVVGFVLLARPNMLHMLFVKPGRIRAGIGRLLWESARSHIERHHPETKTVELNASPFAERAYRALGFYPISERCRREGCVATRMACWLPGRALPKASNAALYLPADRPQN